MNYKKKRIAILVAKNSFVYRGIGSYVKGLFDWALQRGYQVDVISDDEPRNNGLFDQYSADINWIVPDHTISDPVYKGLATFALPFNPMLVVNYRNAMVKAMSKHSYDLVITNGIEALDAVTGIGMQTFTQVLHATHHESEACLPVKHDIFESGVSDKNSSICSIKNVILGAQSDWIKESIVKTYPHKKDETVVIPPIVAERSLLEFQNTENRWGVGFVGPWEPRKNPEEYIRVLKEANLPGVVMVPSESSAKKFRSKFEEAGIEYKIHVAVCGQEKVEVLRSLAAAYHPAVSETFGLGVLETAHTCPTILLSSNDWSHVHKDYTIVTDKKSVVQTLKEVYNKDISSETRSALTERDKNAMDVLDSLATRATIKAGKNNFFERLNSVELVNHEQFVSEAASLCTHEIKKMMRLPYSEGVEVMQTKTASWYRKAGSAAEPNEEIKSSGPVSLFDFD